MHIFDGMIESPLVIASTWVVAGGGVALASRHFIRESKEEHAAFVGVLGAFVFAAQIVNFPILGSPVSAHLTGTALLTVLLGPASAIVMVAAVLLVQCLLFQDGGVLAYGANVCNLALLPAMVVALILRAVPSAFRHRVPIVGVVGFAAVLSSTLAVALELVLGSAVDVRVVTTGLLLIQGVVALAEGVITAIVFVSIRELLGTRTPQWPPRIQED